MQLPRLLVLTTALVGAFWTSLCVSQNSRATDITDYPTHDIKVLSGQAAGSGADAIVRFFSQMLRQEFQRPVVVDNKPGIFGSFAGEALAHAAPDGYTILISGYPAVSSNWILFKDLAYNPVTDFAPITTLVEQPFVLVVSPNSPFRTVAQLTTFLKAKGIKAAFGSANSSGLALCELYKSAEGLGAVKVVYRSSPEIMLGLERGEIDYAFLDSGFATPQIRGGTLRGLAVSSDTRSSALPELPTLSEAGVKQLELASWFAAFAPAGTPAPILNKLYAAFTDILKMPKTKTFASTLGAELFPGTPEGLGALQKQEILRWQHIMQVAHIQPQ